MELGVIESAFMDNIVRKWFLHNLEARVFYRMIRGDALIDLNKIQSILEIGCGRGDGILIHERFYRPLYHSIFDINPSLIKQAYQKKKVLRHDHLKVSVGDVRDIKEPDETFDLVIGYGVLHHIAGWRVALKEVSRVLKPGGLYCWEEPFEYFNNLFLSKLLLSHPDVGMTYRKWMDELERQSLPLRRAWPIKNPFITLGISRKKSD